MISGSLRQTVHRSSGSFRQNVCCSFLGFVSPNRGASRHVTSMARRAASLLAMTVAASRTTKYPWYCDANGCAGLWQAVGRLREAISTPAHSSEPSVHRFGGACARPPLGNVPQSEGAKRRQALVRNAAPGGRLAVGPVPSAEGNGRSITRTGAPIGASPRRFSLDLGTAFWKRTGAPIRTPLIPRGFPRFHPLHQPVAGRTHVVGPGGVSRGPRRLG